MSGRAEQLAAVDIIEPAAERPAAITLGADNSYDAADFVEKLRTLNVRPHVAQNTSGRRSAIDKRTTRHPGYAASQPSASASRKPSAGSRQWRTCGRRSCGPGIQHGGYATCDDYKHGAGYEWICRECFDDLKGDLARTADQQSGSSAAY